MNGKDLIKLMKQNGWVVDRVKGSHHFMVKEGRNSISVPVHGTKDLPKGTLNKILKLAEIK